MKTEGDGKAGRKGRRAKGGEGGRDIEFFERHGNVPPQPSRTEKHTYIHKETRQTLPLSLLPPFRCSYLGERLLVSTRGGRGDGGDGGSDGGHHGVHGLDPVQSVLNVHGRVQGGDIRLGNRGLVLLLAGAAHREDEGKGHGHAHSG